MFTEKQESNWIPSPQRGGFNSILRGKSSDWWAGLLHNNNRSLIAKDIMQSTSRSHVLYISTCSLTPPFVIVINWLSNLLKHGPHDCCCSCFFCAEWFHLPFLCCFLTSCESPSFSFGCTRIHNTYFKALLDSSLPFFIFTFIVLWSTHHSYHPSRS